jgi:hypothetical protein
MNRMKKMAAVVWLRGWSEARKMKKLEEEGDG